jgi:cobalamin biosynthesis protein CbiG
MVLWRINDSGYTATGRSLCAVNSSMFAAWFETLFGQMRCYVFGGAEDIVVDNSAALFSGV